jgi:formylmethanofuran dehydrogenase subunit D
MAVEETLRVVEEMDRDKGKRVARVSRETMQKLSLETGDRIKIVGKKTTLGLVLPAHTEDEKLDIIRISDILRASAAVELNQLVKISKIDGEIASLVVLAPKQPTAYAPGFDQYVKKNLIGKPIETGEIVEIKVYETSYPFTVITTVPDSVVVVSYETEVKLSTEPSGMIDSKIFRDRKFLERKLKFLKNRTNKSKAVLTTEWGLTGINITGNIIQLNEDGFKQLNVTTGDIVEITNQFDSDSLEQKTVLARVEPITVGKFNFARMPESIKDELILSSSSKNIEIRKSTLKPAKKIALVRQSFGHAFLPSDYEINLLKLDSMLDRLLLPGDSFDVAVKNSSIPLVVEKIEPIGPTIVTKDTIVEFTEKPLNHNQLLEDFQALRQYLQNKA